MILKNLYYDKVKFFTIYLVDLKCNSTKICSFFDVPSHFILQAIMDYFSEINCELVVKVFDYNNNYLFCSLENFLQSYRYNDFVRGQVYEF